MSSGRLKRRKLNADMFALDYDPTQRGYVIPADEDANRYDAYMSLDREGKAVWLKALRQLHRDLLQRSMERTRVARTQRASAKHQEAVDAVRLRWQTVVEQVKKRRNVWLSRYTLSGCLFMEKSFLTVFGGGIMLTPRRHHTSSHS